uniref:Thioredoxin domain-containing protein 17 n=1 Tax=Meloidogyne hapla TaxID=6305 RepID=A0A1I8BM87_MELHA
MRHNYCRSTRLSLYEYNKEFNNATFHLFVFASEEWKYSPWCYEEKEKDGYDPPEEVFKKRLIKQMFWPDYYLVDSDGKYNLAGIYPNVIVNVEPLHCFDKCEESSTKSTTTTTTTESFD